MTKNIKIISSFLIIYSFFLITNLYAETVEYRGAAAETFKGMVTKKKINETLQRAKVKACRNAFQRYVQSFEESKRMNFNDIENKIYSDLSTYMICDRIIDEKIDKKQKEVSVVMKASIDVTRLDIEINKSSKIFKTDSGTKSKIAMIFFSRTVSSQRQFDERTSKVEKKIKEIDVSEQQTDTSISSSSTEVNISETGGSKLKKADVSEYIVDENDTAKLEAGMKQVFTKARFEPISGGRLIRRDWRELKDEIIKSLESGGGLPEEARWDIEDLLAEKNVNYVVFAYFDVGIPETDTQSSNQLVNVSLTMAEIMKLGQGDPVSLGTISGIQKKEQGSSNDMAKNNAIRETAESTAKELVALINSKGLN